MLFEYSRTVIAALPSLKAEQLAVALARFHLNFTLSAKPVAWRQFSRLHSLTRSGSCWIVADWCRQCRNEGRPSDCAVKLEATTAQQRTQHAHAQALAQRRVEIGWWACLLVVHAAGRGGAVGADRGGVYRRSSFASLLPGSPLYHPDRQRRLRQIELRARDVARTHPHRVVRPGEGCEVDVPCRAHRDGCARSSRREPVTVTSVSEVAPLDSDGRSQDTSTASSRIPTGAEGQAALQAPPHEVGAALDAFAVLVTAPDGSDYL